MEWRKWQRVLIRKLLRAKSFWLRFLWQELGQMARHYCMRGKEIWAGCGLQEEEENVWWLSGHYVSLTTLFGCIPTLLKPSSVLSLGASHAFFSVVVGYDHHSCDQQKEAQVTVRQLWTLVSRDPFWNFFTCSYLCHHHEKNTFKANLLSPEGCSITKSQ